jgi:hypothetical protein
MNYSSDRIFGMRACLALIAALLLIFPAGVGAEEDQSGFSMSVPGVKSITIESGTLIFAPDLNQLLDGWTTVEALDATLSSNEDWLLTISGSQATWTGPWSKPVGDIYWSYSAGDFTALTTSSAEVTSGAPVADGSIQIDFKIALDLGDDIPGNYSYTYVVLELTAP